MTKQVFFIDFHAFKKRIPWYEKEINFPRFKSFLIHVNALILLNLDKHQL